MKAWGVGGPYYHDILIVRTGTGTQATWLLPEVSRLCSACYGCREAKSLGSGPLSRSGVLSSSGKWSRVSVKQTEESLALPCQRFPVMIKSEVI